MTDCGPTALACTSFANGRAKNRGNTSRIPPMCPAFTYEPANDDAMNGTSSGFTKREAKAAGSIEAVP